MANKVFETVEIEFQDGNVVVLKPLPIKYLRKFMEIIESVPEDADGKDIEVIGKFVEATVVALKDYPDYASVDYVEETLDLPTMLKVLEAAGGITLTQNPLVQTATANL